jgi:hypothetical protein
MPRGKFLITVAVAPCARPSSADCSTANGRSSHFDHIAGAWMTSRLASAQEVGDVSRWFIRYPRPYRRRIGSIQSLIIFVVWVYVCMFILMVNLLIVPFAVTSAVVRASQQRRSGARPYRRPGTRR